MADRLLATLEVIVNYGQITVHLPEVERPGHVWGDAELEQGFAWSPGIVSFGMPEHSEECRVDVVAATAVDLSPNAISAVSVPFSVPGSPIRIGSVFHFDEVDVAPGNYTLVGEVLPWDGPSDAESAGGRNYALCLHFVKRLDDGMQILKVGGAVRSEGVLNNLSALV